MTVATITATLYLTLGVIITLLGLIILKENFKQRINRITGVMMFFAGAGPIFAAFGILLQFSARTTLDLEPFRKIFLIWEFFFPQMLLFSLVFPKEIPWTKTHSRWFFLLFLPHALHFILMLSFSSPEQIHNLINLDALSDRFGIIIQPVTILLGLVLSLAAQIYQFHTNFFALINLIYIITAIGLMVWGYRDIKNPHLKKQVGLVLWGIRASMGLYAIAFLFPHLNILKTSQPVAYFLTTVALMIGAGSIAWAIIRHQFLDIRLIIRRGLIFSLASSILIGIYLLIYSQGKRLISSYLGIEIPILEILFIILTLLFFQPILGVIERFIETIFMKDRLDYRNVLQNLSHDIMTTLDNQVLQEKIIKTLTDVMSLHCASLLQSNQEGSFVCTNETSIRFNGREPWIQVLKDSQSPIGLNQLSLQVPEDLSIKKLEKLHASLLVPFRYRGNLIAILTLSEKITNTNFSTEEMTILSVLSDHAAIALENARLYEAMLEKQRIEKELGFAREIQRNLLPAQPLKRERFELTGVNIPSKEIGGDYFDYIEHENDQIGIAIGDIAGKGIPAAILMSNLQAALRVSASRESNTGNIMRLVNIHITRTTSAEKFATFFYGILDEKTYQLRYTNAGHNYPILLRSNGEIHLLKEGGIIIGILEKAEYKEHRIQLRPGDLLVFYTDGVTEALDENDDEYGENRLIDVIRKSAHLKARDIMDFILESVVEFTHGHIQTDDLTLVVLKTTP